MGRRAMRRRPTRAEKIAAANKTVSPMMRELVATYARATKRHEDEAEKKRQIGGQPATNR